MDSGCRRIGLAAGSKNVERCTGYSLSGFVCTRSDLLSGEITRVLRLSPLEGVFVDRIVLAGVIVSAVTVWGEELLAQVPIPCASQARCVESAFHFPERGHLERGGISPVSKLYEICDGSSQTFAPQLLFLLSAENSISRGRSRFFRLSCDPAKCS